MSDLEIQRALKRRLDRTWSAFFARYGKLRPVQVQAIPAVLDGRNVVLWAATASGKTEAALAPLIERHCPPLLDGITPLTLQIVYLTPTRALVNNLYQRLQPVFEVLRLPLAVKTRDFSNFSPKCPPTLLITTPESLDSLLCRCPEVFIDLRAVVIDELHIFDETPRGDQIKVLLNRLRIIQAYARQGVSATVSDMQYVALSATLSNPQIAARYFPDPLVIEVDGQRQLNHSLIDIADPKVAVFQEVWKTIREKRWRKVLVFCNSRAEVEHYAHLARIQSPFGEAVFVHYSNLSPLRRKEIESAFSQAETAICFASSTLELGIDIGDVDATILIGPPGSTASFSQRIGRAGRRTSTVSILGVARTDLEHLLFEVLFNAPKSMIAAAKPFQHGVAIQQLFSLLKQHPKASVRLLMLYETLKGCLPPREIDDMVADLTEKQYLRLGRPGEWRAGVRLNTLIDAQYNTYQEQPNLHSNIRGMAHSVEIRNQHTDQVLASVEPHWMSQETMTIEGRSVQIQWVEGDALWVNTTQSSGETNPAHTASRQLLTLELAQAVAAHLGFEPGEAPIVQTNDGWRCYHWLGDLYGEMLADLLRAYLLLRDSAEPGLYLVTDDPIGAIPSIQPAHIADYLVQHNRRLETVLNLSPFHALLSRDVRQRSVAQQVDIVRFETLLRQLRPTILNVADQRASLVISL